MQYTWILASDIDNTLTGDREALQALGRHLQAQREAGELFLILSTGRRLNQVLDGFAHEALPTADAIISQVGTEIYLPPFTADSAPMPAWESRLLQAFSREEALSFFAGIPGLEMQPARYNTPLKVSCYLDEAPDPDAAAAQIRQRVRESGKDDVYQVIWSSGKDLDVIPTAAGKGKAIHYVIDFLGLDPALVIVAGDSGNDRSMFDEFGRGIVVGNAQPELRRLEAEAAAAGRVYFAQAAAAAGVSEGLRHFGVM